MGYNGRALLTVICLVLISGLIAGNFLGYFEMTSFGKGEASYIIPRFHRNPTILIRSKTQPDFLIYVHNPTTCIYVSHPMIFLGVYDTSGTERFQQILRNCLSTSTTVHLLDVGANIGWYSLLGAAMGAQVTALEPLDFNLELLKESVKVNNFESKITWHKAAVGDEHSKGERKCMKPAWLGNVLENTGNGQLYAANSSDCMEEVSLMTLDDVLDESVHYQIVKIDIEGWETRALRGARKLWNRPPCYILAEHYKEYVHASGIAWEHQLFFDLRKRGYKCYNRNAPLAEISEKEILNTHSADFEFRLEHVDCPPLLTPPKR